MILNINENERFKKSIVDDPSLVLWNYDLCKSNLAHTVQSIKIAGEEEIQNIKTPMSLRQRGFVLVGMCEYPLLLYFERAVAPAKAGFIFVGFGV